MAATSVLVANLSEFPDSGTVRIGDEVLTYRGKQPLTAPSLLQRAASSQVGWLLNLQRGVNGTEPSSHNAGETVILVAPGCVGDCDADGVVTVDELTTMVNIALGNEDASECARGDGNADSAITVDEITTAVQYGLNGCP